MANGGTEDAHVVLPANHDLDFWTNSTNGKKQSLTILAAPPWSILRGTVPAAIRGGEPSSLLAAYMDRPASAPVGGARPPGAGPLIPAVPSTPRAPPLVDPALLGRMPEPPQRRALVMTESLAEKVVPLLTPRGLVGTHGPKLLGQGVS